MDIFRNKLRIPTALVLLAVVLTACAPTPTALPPTGMPTASETPLVLPSPNTEDTLAAPLPNLPTVSAPSLSRIEMQDVLHGWGVTDTNLVRTLDGGTTWHDVTPPGVTRLGLSSSVYFLDPDHGWLVIPSTDFQTDTLYHTTDGGLTWSSGTQPFGGGILFFADEDTGFILVDRGAAAGSQAVDLYSTQDGGTTWSAAYVMQPGVGGNVNTLPFSGQKSGVTFSDSLHGWVGGNIPMEGNVYLYATQDGGHTWTKQPVTLPAGYTNAMTEVFQSRFFTSSDAVIPMRMMAVNFAFDFLVSHDGGMTWAATTPVLAGGQYSIPTIQDFFVWDGGTSLSVSHDGGSTWTSVTPNLNVTDILMKFVFVDASNGWMLTSDASNHHSLYRTSDGGQTWNPLIP